MREYPDDYCPCAEGAGCPTPDEWFCWTHHRHEPPKKQSFRHCFECGHVYGSAEELVNEYINGGRAAGMKVEHVSYHPLMAVERIHFCPLCLHDW